MGLSSDIESMLSVVDMRKGFAYEGENAELITKAILLHAKMMREVANEIVAALDELNPNR
jgi:hypothetical protein